MTEVARYKHSSTFNLIIKNTSFKGNFSKKHFCADLYLRKSHIFVDETFGSPVTHVFLPFICLPIFQIFT